VPADNNISHTWVAATEQTGEEVVVDVVVAEEDLHLVQVEDKTHRTPTCLREHHHQIIFASDVAKKVCNRLLVYNMPIMKHVCIDCIFAFCFLL
jgi:hypothetical protein